MFTCSCFVFLVNALLLGQHPRNDLVVEEFHRQKLDTTLVRCLLSFKSFVNLPYLLHRISQPHDVGGLPTGLGLGGVQRDVQVGHVGELGVDLFRGVHKVLYLGHGELSGGKEVSFGAGQVQYFNLLA